MIRLLLGTCALIFLIEASYFATHRTKMYFGLPMKHPANVKTISQLWLVIMAAMTLLAGAATISLNLPLIFATLILGCVVELLMAISVSSLLLKP